MSRITPSATAKPTATLSPHSSNAQESDLAVWERKTHLEELKEKNVVPSVLETFNGKNVFITGTPHPSQRFAFSFRTYTFRWH
jgi:hypothetical protein